MASESCKHCGSPIEIRSRERPGPLGFASYCSNSECRSSYRAHKERLRKKLYPSTRQRAKARHDFYLRLLYFGAFALVVLAVAQLLGARL